MRQFAPLAILLSVLALGVTACGGSDSGAESAAKPTVPAGAVAVVGKETITQKQFDSLFVTAIGQGKANGQEPPAKGSAEEKTLQQQIVQSLVQNAEIRQEAGAKGIKVDQKRVQADLTAFKLQCCQSKQADYDKYLKDQGLTEQDLLDQFALRQQAQALFDDVTKAVKVTDDEALKQYETDKATKFSTARSRKVAHILIDVKPKGKGTQADCDRAAEVLKEVEAGGDWKALVKQYSADPGSKDAGGEYTITDDEKWDADFRKGAFGLETGKITDPPVKSQFGCHIIKALGDIIAAKTQPFSEVKQQVIDELTQTKKNEVATKWFESVQKSYVPMTAFAKGYGLPPVSPTTTADSTTTG